MLITNQKTYLGVNGELIVVQMSVYNLQADDLKNLGQYRAVELVRRLLWAESSRVGISRNLLEVPDCINVGDGGLDSAIEDAKPSSEDVIPSGPSGLQIKSSDLAPAECKKELHQSKSRQNPLKPEIKRLLDNDGTYILVIFADITYPMKRRREEAVREELGRMGYANPKIRIYTLNQIMSFVERFPSLVAWLKGYPSECLSYDKWAENRDVNSPKIFVYDEQRTSIAVDIREKIRDPEGGKTPIFRITGLSGLGKTRLAFETLSPNDVRNKTVYVRAKSFRNSTLLNMLLMDENLEATIVADECSLDNHDYLVRYFSQKGPRLALITISHEMGDVPIPTLHYRLKPLSKDGVKELLSKEMIGLPPDVIERLTDFADGYPRIAMLLAENYLTGAASREDILTLNDEALINRLIAGKLDPGSGWFRKTKKVLMGLSLFEKVGFEGEVSQEAKWVAGLVNVDWNEFQEVVREQQQRGIIQGKYYIYVTPFLLAVHLFREWWKTHGKREDLGSLIGSMPQDFRQDMMNRFFSRFPFITSTEPGRNLVRKLLSKQGIFADGSLLKTVNGSQLFLRLTEADPGSAIHCLKRTMGTWNKEQLLEFRAGRRQIVWALERIAVWRELFPDAARLLLALGEAENESYANNASGIFADLFSPAWGRISPTEAPPRERFPILLEAINSDSTERKKLALRTFRRALQWGGFHRMVGVEYQGARAPAELWTPRTFKEIFDYLRMVWGYLNENLIGFDEEIRDEAVGILLQSARGIASINPSLSEMVVQTFRKLSSYPWIDKSRLLEAVLRITHYDSEKMPESTLESWIKLRDELTDSSFSGLLKRFVGMELLEDYFHDGESYDTRWVESKACELGKKAMENPNLLEPEYSWLTTEQAKNGHLFGYELGKLDAEFSLLEKLMQEQKKTGPKGSVHFLGGYFRALFEKNKLLWEDKLESLSKDDSLKRFVPELTWRSGITDRAAKRILLMAEKGEIEIDAFWIFRFGGVIKRVSEPIFVDYVNFLLEEPSGLGPLIALELSYFYHADSSRTPNKDLTLTLLLHPAFWEKGKSVPQNQLMRRYYWKELARILISQFPETEDLLAEQVIKFLGDERSIAAGFHTQIHEILVEMVERNPDKFWVTIAKYLGPPIDRRAFYVRSWLRGEKGLTGRPSVLDLFNPDDVWKWVDEDINNRAWYLATFVPPYLFHSEEKICLAREMLVRYGKREDVRRNFSANYSTEGWMGPASVHYTAKKNELLEFKRKERNANVVKWIEEYIETLEKDIERAKMMEERETY